MRLYVRVAMRVFEVEPPGGRMGRAPGLAVSVDDPSVLAEHAAFTWDGQRWWVKQLGSKPIYLDAAPLPGTMAPLPPQGKLQAGNALLDFWQEGQSPLDRPVPATRSTSPAATMIQVPARLTVLTPPTPEAPAGIHEVRTMISRGQPPPPAEPPTQPPRLSRLDSQPEALQGDRVATVIQRPERARDGAIATVITRPAADSRGLPPPPAPPLQELSTQIVRPREEPVRPPVVHELETMVKRGQTGPQPQPAPPFGNLIAPAPAPPQPRQEPRREPVITTQGMATPRAWRNRALLVQAGVLLGLLSVICLVAFLFGMYEAPPLPRLPS